MEQAKKRRILREQSLILPDIQNPFTHRIRFSTLDKIQIAIMTFTVVPVRLFLIGVCLIIGWAFAAVALMGRTKEDMKEPLTGWRRAMSKPLIFIGRSVAFLMGFHKIKITGQRAMAGEAGLLTVAPHSSFYDSFICFVGDQLPIGVSRIENLDMPLFGTLTAFTQPVFVSREDPNSRQNTIKEIKKRATSAGKWPQIVIFPEGTCTNRTCLITFKPGAFIPGVPVQPVCLRYTNRMDTITWTWDGPGAFTLLWLTLCQFNNQLEVIFLPVYQPSEEEKNDPKLFGSNVRKVMAEALGVPVTDHTFEDCRLMNYAAKLKLPGAAYLVEFQKISKKLGVNFNEVKGYMDKFVGMAQKNKEYIGLEEFSEYLGIPVSDRLRELFELYDRDGTGKIDFREYVIGLHLIAQPANSEETIELAFKLFDKGEKGYITESELGEMLEQTFAMNVEEISQLFAQVDKDQNGKITYDEFKAYAEEKPEYARLYRSYHDMDTAELGEKTQESTIKVNGTTAHSPTKVTNISATSSNSEAKVKDE